MTKRFEDVSDLVDMIIARRGKSLKVGFPLGLGKPNHLANELVDRAVAGEIEYLEIFTALSLSRPPDGTNDLQRRLMAPILDRLFGEYPDLKFVQMRARGELPDNIVVHEFYYTPGSLLSSQIAQRHYKSVNFTDAFREMRDAGLDLIGQMVAPGEEGGWDLSSNTDLSLSLYEAIQKMEECEQPLLVAQVNRRAPAMGSTAEVDEDLFDAILDHPRYDHELFGLPSLPVSDAEIAIGLRVASLLRDGGTVQIGIGGLGEAVSWAAILRHTTPGRYRELLDAIGWTGEEKTFVETWGGVKKFEQGLYAASEMFVEGLLRMAKAGVLTRRVDDGAVLHAAFYLGSPRFYESLRELSPAMRKQLQMRSVLFTNLLYGDEEKKREQRAHARFINSAMMVTALGAVVSDGLEDGRVVSGVGGQFEFVAMAHALDDGRSVITLPATRTSNGQVRSNIVWNYGHCTIPRHLRDIVVTEYGIADLRGKSDEQIVEAMLAVCDARFQDELVEEAKEAGKLAQDFEVPEHMRRNRPEVLRENLFPFRQDGTVARCPFGSSLTEIELDLVEALQHLRGIADDLGARQIPEFSATALINAARVGGSWDEHLARMGLSNPESIQERLMRRAVVYGLRARDGQ